MIGLGSRTGNLAETSDGNLAQLIASIVNRITSWKTDVNFDAGTHDDTERVGTNDNAKIQLEENTDNDDDMLFNVLGNYTSSDSDKITIDNGKAKLKPSTANYKNYPFTTPANYTYNSSLIDVASGKTNLKGSPVIPYAWYKLNDGGGNIASDSSGNGRNGTFGYSEESDWTTGKVSGGLNYDDTDSVILGDIADFEYNQDFSFDAWVKMSGSGYRAVISNFQQISGEYRGWEVNIINTGEVRILIANCNSNRLIKTSTTTIDDSNWHHIAFTYNGTVCGGGASGLKIYIDGSEETTSTESDTLSATIVSGLNMTMGKRPGADMGANFEGVLDNVAIYDEVLTSSHITTRYNSGSGTEDAIDGYSLEDPDIITNDGFSFSNPLDTFEVNDTIPAGTGLKHFVSADGGTTWKYWTGSAWATITAAQTNSWYYENEANTEAEINANISSLASSGTFKCRSFLHSDNGFYTPEIDNIYIAENITYATDDNLYIDTKDAAQIAPATIYSWLTTTITNNMPANTDIKIMFSNDGRTNWLTWDSTAWSNPSSSTSRSNGTTIADAQTNFSSLPKGNGTLDVRIFLYTSDNSVTPDIDNINVTSDAGYKTSGTYTSNLYNSECMGIGWSKIEFELNVPANTTAVIKCRSSNCSSEMGDWSVALSNGDELTCCGCHFQWKIEMTSNGQATPELDNLSVTWPGILQNIIEGA